MHNLGLKVHLVTNKAPFLLPLKKNPIRRFSMLYANVCEQYNTSKECHESSPTLVKKNKIYQHLQTMT